MTSPRLPASLICLLMLSESGHDAVYDITPLRKKRHCYTSSALCHEELFTAACFCDAVSLLPEVYAITFMLM